MGVALVICSGWWDIALIVTLSVAIFLKISALMSIQVLRYAQDDNHVFFFFKRLSIAMEDCFLSPYEFLRRSE